MSAVVVADDEARAPGGRGDAWSSLGAAQIGEATGGLTPDVFFVFSHRATACVRVGRWRR